MQKRDPDPITAPEEGMLAQDLARLFSLSKLEAVAYRDFSRERAAHRQHSSHEAADSVMAVDPSSRDRAPAPVATPIAPPAEAGEVDTPAEVQSPVLRAIPDGPAGIIERGSDLDSQKDDVTPTVDLPSPRYPAVASQSLREGVKHTLASKDIAWTKLALYSPDGKVGVSSLCANLASVFHEDGGSTLLVDGSGKNALPLYFGASSRHTGMRQFRPPAAESPSLFICSDTDPSANWMKEVVQRETARASRTLFDLDSELKDVAREALTSSELLIVPVLPNLGALLAVETVDRMLSRLRSQGLHCPSPFFVLNRFDQHSPLHCKARLLIEAECGSRLLPVVLHEDRIVEDAASHRMTLVDFCPSSALAQSYREVGAIVNRLPASLVTSHPARWSEL